MPVRTWTDKTDLRKPALVFVKAEWCPHCQHAKPEIQKAADIMGSVVPIHTIDGDKHKAGVSKLRRMGLKVDGYPTIAFVNASGKATPYTGPRKGKDIADWACAQSGNCARSSRA